MGSLRVQALSTEDSNALLFVILSEAKDLLSFRAASLLREESKSFDSHYVLRSG